MIASSRRLKNLGEILSPTVEPSKPSSRQHPNTLPARGQSRDRGRRRGAADRSGEREEFPQGMDGQLRNEDELRAGAQQHSSQGQEEPRNGTYHSYYQKRSRKCDVCKDMIELNSVLSSHFKRNHAIAGNNIHLKATQTPKIRWFIYLRECSRPEGKYQYIGSTNSVLDRWAKTKSQCLGGGSEGTGFKKSIVKRVLGLGNLNISFSNIMTLHQSYFSWVVNIEY